MHPSREEENEGGEVEVCSVVKEFGPFSFLAMDTSKLGVGFTGRLDFNNMPVLISMKFLKRNLNHALRHIHLLVLIYHLEFQYQKIEKKLN